MTEVDFTGLANYDEILIIGTIAKDAAGAIFARLSTDNGSSFVNGASAYTNFLEGGAAALDRSSIFIGNSDTNTYRFWFHFRGLKASGISTLFDGVCGIDSGNVFHSSGWAASAATHNAIRIGMTANNITTGSSMQVYGR